MSMLRLNAMKNRESGKVCWIAYRAKEYFSQMGVEYGSKIEKLAGWGDAVIVSCGGKHYAVNGIADGLAVVPEESA